MVHLCDNEDSRLHWNLLRRLIGLLWVYVDKLVSVGAAGGPYDAVITNPPFAQSGKFNRRYFIDELILNSHKLLRGGGRTL